MVVHLLINNNKLKFTILALCSAVFIMSIANCTPVALAIPDVFDSPPSLQTLSIGDNVITCPPLSCTGTPEDDIMIGTALGDTMFGLGGNDNIQGNGDADVIYGGDGGDNIQGGEGSDTIFGQDGNDFLLVILDLILYSAVVGTRYMVERATIICMVVLTLMS